VTAGLGYPLEQSGLRADELGRYALRPGVNFSSQQLAASRDWRGSRNLPTNHPKNLRRVFSV